MNLRYSVASVLARASAWSLVNLAGRNATQLPGRIALAVDPGILQSLRSKIVAGSVVVCGTNGKTTTNNIIAEALERSGISLYSNRVGANMLPGVVAALLPSGRRSWAVIEADELSCSHILPQLKPSYLILLNLFRDQLDRSGEIDHVQDVIASSLDASPDTKLIVCADDPMSMGVARRITNADSRLTTFGIGQDLKLAQDRVAEARFCQVCGHELDYTYHLYAQLGSYSCPDCDFCRPALDFEARNCVIDQTGVTFDVFSFELDEPVRLHAGFGGAYMIYNVLAAFIAAYKAGVDPQVFQETLDTYKPDNGRLQHFVVDGLPITLNLAKNPTGFNQNLSLMLADKRSKALVLSINDNANDGHDISWIWDIDFERLLEDMPTHIFVSGTRANDVQVRLKYAGLQASLITTVQEALDVLNTDANSSAETLYVLTNYSALWPAKAELEKLEEDARG